MLEQFIAEATECDFKQQLEERKPKSWLKSVSAFANGIGGTLFFGIKNDREVCGLEDAQGDAEKISRLIKVRISPIPDFLLRTEKVDTGETVLVLEIKTGVSTPYYYSADGIRQAFIRLGNESVPAPEHILNELILKGSNRTYDSIVTEHKKSDYSFTLLEASYLERTGIHISSSDYISFGLVTKDGLLTRAGALLADQSVVYQSRLFCTRWNRLLKGSIFDDALDDKEYKGSLIYLLNNGIDFIRNNSKVRFTKQATRRVDKPDYADRAVTECLVKGIVA